jgi:hypothetical protein
MLSIHPKCFVQSARSLDLVVTVLLHPVRRFDPESFFFQSISFSDYWVSPSKSWWFLWKFEGIPKLGISGWYLALFSYMLHDSDTFFFFWPPKVAMAMDAGYCNLQMHPDSDTVKPWKPGSVYLLFSRVAVMSLHLRTFMKTWLAWLYCLVRFSC